MFHFHGGHVLLRAPDVVARGDIDDEVVLAVVVASDGQRLCAAMRLEGPEVRDVALVELLTTAQGGVAKEFTLRRAMSIEGERERLRASRERLAERPRELLLILLGLPERLLSSCPCRPMGGSPASKSVLPALTTDRLGGVRSPNLRLEGSVVDMRGGSTVGGQRGGRAGP